MRNTIPICPGLTYTGFIDKRQFFHAKFDRMPMYRTHMPHACAIVFVSWTDLIQANWG
jgi:hypothetical protein